MSNTATLAEDKQSILNNILPEDVVKKGHNLRIIF
jgi:hypothetical protein